MNGLNNFDKTGREYSLAPVDDLVRLWRSKVKVTANASTLMHRIKSHLLVLLFWKRIFRENMMYFVNLCTTLWPNPFALIICSVF